MKNVSLSTVGLTSTIRPAKPPCVPHVVLARVDPLAHTWDIAAAHPQFPTNARNDYIDRGRQSMDLAVPAIGLSRCSSVDGARGGGDDTSAAELL